MYYCSIPHRVLDTSQTVSQKVSGTISNLVSPIKPLQSFVDKTGSGFSNVLGTTSRMLGKDVETPPKLVFLYTQTLRYPGHKLDYMDAVKKIIGLALLNVVFHAKELNADKVTDLSTMPMLSSMAKVLREKGADEDDIDDLVTLLGRNGTQDITQEMRGQVCVHILISSRILLRICPAFLIFSSPLFFFSSFYSSFYFHYTSSFFYEDSFMVIDVIGYSSLSSRPESFGG